jgi:hypothetical protein
MYFGIYWLYSRLIYIKFNGKIYNWTNYIYFCYKPCNSFKFNIKKSIFNFQKIFDNNYKYENKNIKTSGIKLHWICNRTS